MQQYSQRSHQRVQEFPERSQQNQWNLLPFRTVIFFREIHWIHFQSNETEFALPNDDDDAGSDDDNDDNDDDDDDGDDQNDDDEEGDDE